MLIAQHFGGVQLAIMPGALDELYHQDLQALPHGAKSRTQRGRGLPLARTRMHDNQPFSFFWQEELQMWDRLNGGSGHRSTARNCRANSSKSAEPITRLIPIISGTGNRAAL